jgi:GTP-binding protein
VSTRADSFFTGPCDFAFGAATIGALPPISLPEFAFIGRSNVGKSSLLNALTAKAKLADVSSTPGRTQQLNFFRLGRRCFLVDVPGYGFAKAPKEKVAVWQNTLRHYLRERTSLRRSFVLIDARHGLLKADFDMFATLDEAAQSYQLVLTKTDQIEQAELAALDKSILSELKHHPAAYPEIMASSSKAGTGITALRSLVFALLNA